MTLRLCLPRVGQREHNKELAASKSKLADLREAKDEEAGKLEFEVKQLKADLDIANQKAKVMMLLLCGLVSR